MANYFLVERVSQLGQVSYTKQTNDLNLKSVNGGASFNKLVRFCTISEQEFNNVDLTTLVSTYFPKG